MKTHEQWMDKVIEEAEASAKDGDAPISAFVVKDDVVLGVGRCTKTSEKCGFAHAELNALLKAKQKLGRKPEGVVLYCTLEPCAMCLGAILFAGIRTVVYGASDPEGGAVGMFRENPTYRNWMPEIISGIMAAECEELKKMPSFRKG